MEYLQYLIYPIAGLLALFAFGGVCSRSPIVVVSSLFSLGFNIYAIAEFIWWPIAASIAVDYAFKALFGDPGSQMG